MTWQKGLPQQRFLIDCSFVFSPKALVKHLNVRLRLETLVLLISRFGTCFSALLAGLGPDLLSCDLS